MNQLPCVGIVLVLLGILYFLKPNFFRRGIWLKTSIAVRTMSPEGYIRYMRGLGVVLMIAGVVLFIFGTMHPLP